MTLDLFSKEPTSSADFSTCGAYRYRLERRWDADRAKVAFIMLNPSTADASEDDPTIRRCIRFAKDWGFSGLIVGNLFALRSTDPQALYSHPDPIGADNDKHLGAIARSAETIICAWGTHGALHDRGREVAEMLNDFNLAALKLTAKGHPGHPLYVAAETQPKAFFA
ncbi:DUF1643 domain-containing protein [Rhizobium ruizarguesonis]